MTRTSHTLSSAFVALAILAHASPSVADEGTVDSAAEARQQYQDGTKAFAAKRYSEAALHFEAAASFKANAVALYTAGLAWDLASRPERAADAYTRALDVAGLDAKQTNVAKDRVQSLEKSLGTLSVTAPESGWKVQLDTLTEVAAPARLHASPGVHTLSVRAANKSIEKRDVTLEAGRVTSLELKKEEPKPPPKVEPEPPREKPAPPPPPDVVPARLREPFWTNIKVAGVGVAGLGVAALGATAILGLNANDAKDAYNAAPSRAGYDHASSLETWTNISLIAGAVLVAGGVALVAVPIGGSESQAKIRASVTPGGIGVGGTF